MPPRVVAFNVTANVAQMTQAVTQFTAGIQQMQQSVTTLANAVNAQTTAINTRMSSFANQTREAANMLDSNLSRALYHASLQGSTLGSTLGVLAANAIRGLIQDVRTLGADVLSLVRDFERLQFSFSTLSAIELVNLGEFEDVSSALGEAEERATAYLYVMQNLAILSPFTTRQIADGNKLLRVYGFLEQEAINMTQVMTDWASGAGVSPEFLDRIALAIGQIRAEGRLLARDVLQLSSAGLPAMDIVAKKLGLTVGQLQKEMRTGFVGSTVALQAIVEFMEQFEGSGERVSDTLNGVVSSIQDATEITSLYFFQNIFEQALPSLTAFRDILASPQFRGSVIVLGELIGTQIAGAIRALSDAVGGLIRWWNSLSTNVKNGIIAFVGAAAAITAFAFAAGTVLVVLKTLVNPFTVATLAVATFVGIYVSNFEKIQRATQSAVSFIARAVSTLADIFGAVASAVIDATGTIVDQFSSTASAAFDWGTAITTALASGIEGAVGIVATAVGTIGSMISYLLAANSPPRILPELEEWGRAAADVYLSGWTEADFSIFNRFSSALEGLLRGLVTQGEIRENQVIPKLLEGRQDLAQAIGEIQELGSVSQETMRELADSTSGVSDEMLGLITRYQALAQENAEVTRLQNLLNDETKRYEAILKPLYAQLNQATNSKQFYDEQLEIAELQRLIATEGVSSTRKQAAQARIAEIEAERQIRTTEEQRDLAVDSVQAQLDLAQEAQKTAQAELDALLARIEVQTTNLTLTQRQIDLLEREAEAARRAAEAYQRAQEQAERERIKALTAEIEKQLKLFKAQQDELRDLIDIKRQEYILSSDAYTEAEKANARVQLQLIDLEREKRRVELGILGFDPTLLDYLGQVQIVLEDLNIPKKKQGDETEGTDTGELVFQNQVDLEQAMKDMQKAIDDARESFRLYGNQITKTAQQIDDALPSFLKLRDESGASPLADTLLSIFGGVAAAMLVSRIGLVLKSLTGLSGGMSLLTGVTALTTAAWIGNWFDIQTKAERAIKIIQIVIDRLNFEVLLESLGNIGEAIETAFATENIETFDDLKRVIGEITAVINEEIGKWVDSFGGWEGINDTIAYAIRLIKDFVGTFALINAIPIAAIGLRILGMFGGFSVFGTIAKVAISGVASVLSTVLSPAVLIAGAVIGGAILAWNTDFLGFQTAVKKVLDAVGIDLDTFGKAFEPIRQIGKDTIDSLKDAFQRLREEGFGNVSAIADEAITSIRTSFNTNFPKVQSAVDAGLEKIRERFDNFSLEGFVDVFGELAALWIRSFGTQVGALLRWIIGTAIPSIIKGIGWALNALVHLPSEIVNIITDDEFTTGIGKALNDHIIPALNDAIVSIVNGIFLGIDDAFGLKEGTTLKRIENFFFEVDKFLSSFFGKTFQSEMDSFSERIWSSITDNYSAAKGELLSIPQQVDDTFAVFGEKLAGYIVTVENATNDGVGQIERYYDAWRTMDAWLGPWLAEKSQQLASWLAETHALYKEWAGKTWWGPAVQEGTDAVGQWLADKSAELGDALNKTSVEVQNLVIKLWDYIANTPERIVAAFATYVTKITAEAVQFVELGTNLANSLVSAISDTVALGYEFVITAIAGWFTRITAAATRLLELGINLANSLIGSIESTVSAAYTTIQDALLDMFKSVTGADFIIKVGASMFSIGTSIIDGIITGVTSKLENLKTSISDAIVGTLPEFLRNQIDAHSPSGLFMRLVGEPIAEGITEGARQIDAESIASILRGVLVDDLAGIQASGASITNTLRESVEANIHMLRRNVQDSVRFLEENVSDVFELLRKKVSESFEAMRSSGVEKAKSLKEVVGDTIVMLRVEFERDIAAMTLFADEELAELPTMAREYFDDMYRVAVTKLATMVEEIITNENSLLKSMNKAIDADWAAKGTAIGDTWISNIIAAIEGKKQTLINLLDAIKALVEAPVPGTSTGGGSAENLVQSLITAVDSLRLAIITLNQTMGGGVTTSSTTERSLAPVYNPALQGGAVGSSVSNSSAVYYNLNVSSRQESSGIIRDFGLMRVLAR